MRASERFRAESGQMPRPTLLRLVTPPAGTASSHPVAEELVVPESAPSSRGGHRALAGLPDAALVALASGGDSAAAECLYRRHAAFAMNLAARVAGNASDVEDVVHDAFLKAFQKLERLRDPAAFRMWLGTIVVHGVRSRLRREKLRRVLGLSQARGAMPVELDRIASPSASPATRAELAQVYALLGTLPADDRIAWTLRYIEGHELEEAATLAGCSLATVKRRIHRAQAHLDTHFVEVEPRAAAEDELR